MMGVGYALLVSTVFQVIIKTLIGGFRPYFLDVCQPDISRVASHDTTGLNGVGFQGIMYTVDVCTNPDKAALRGAMMSFPSGHATAAFAGFGFLFLWMNAKLKVWANYRTSIWWLALLFAPLLAAVLQACVLTVDMAHNWYDILAGAVIGTVMAFASYRVMYASVFDWRYNHIPLRRTEVFDYPSGTGVLGLTERHVFVRKHGWGRERHGSRRGGAWLRRVLPGSGSTSTVGTARYPKPQQCPDHHATKSTPLPDRAEMQEEHQRSVVAGGEIV
jgi:membrane-associated phospholipid phosphatase